MDRIQTKLSTQQRQFLAYKATTEGITVSEIIRGYIRKDPDYARFVAATNGSGTSDDDDDGVATKVSPSTATKLRSEERLRKNPRADSPPAPPVGNTGPLDHDAYHDDLSGYDYDEDEAKADPEIWERLYGNKKK